MTANAKDIELNLISKYRSVLMGIAIIFVMVCHLDVAQRHNGITVTKFARIIQTGSVGVDIFMFLSGFGLCFSYTKNPLPYFVFERKRILRVVPLYLIIGGLTYLVYDLFIKKLGFLQFLRDFLFISWFRGEGTRYWYILAIIGFYLLFPFLYRLIQKTQHCLPLLIVISIIWWFAVETLCMSITTISTFRMALSRLPIFAFGIFCGKQALEGKVIARSVLVAMLFLGYFALYILKRWIPNPLATYINYSFRGLLGISIIITVILLLEILDRLIPTFTQSTKAGLSWFGGLTLELYLLHQSYLIFFEYPYQLSIYPIVAILLPIATAAVIWWYRNKRKARSACEQ